MACINATPHAVTIMREDGSRFIFPKSAFAPIRCTQRRGAREANVSNCPVYAAGPYALDKRTVAPYAKSGHGTIIVSTIVALDLETLRSCFAYPIQVLVPNADDSAGRDAKGQVEYVTSFLSY